MVNFNTLTDEFLAGKCERFSRINFFFPAGKLYLQPGEPGLMPGKGENLVQLSPSRVISTRNMQKTCETKILSIEKLADLIFSWNFLHQKSDDPAFSSNFSLQKLDNPPFSSNFHIKNRTIHLSQAIFHIKNWTIHLSQAIFHIKNWTIHLSQAIFTPKIGRSSFLKQFSLQKSLDPAFSSNFHSKNRAIQLSHGIFHWKLPICRCLPGKVMTGMSIKEKNLKYKNNRRNQNGN
jgi:hypothetical protein